MRDSKVNINDGATQKAVMRGGSFYHHPWYDRGEVIATLYRGGKVVQTVGPTKSASPKEAGASRLELDLQTGDVLYIEDRLGTTHHQRKWLYVVKAENGQAWVRSMYPPRGGDAPSEQPAVTREEFLLDLAEEVSNSLVGLDEEESKTVVELALLRPEFRAERLKNLLDE
ncbi:MAG: hypothetical protein KGJ23_07920 [Euryarchaeota archaeon]|nr:hypothetical protein [Euryarchaeota archaeon]MDE1836527.1 hypothetical protein [Euryarchaeota archaeon]MDE1879278.1 hypothetical protein [Euryarchaeota archaeon]MDE2044497.1 hypothetical protein [Thermoplasmata archaeon]